MGIRLLSGNYQVFDNPEPCGDGVDGSLYRISEDKVVKVDFSPQGRDINEVFEIQQALFLDDIAVPAPHDVVDVYAPKGSLVSYKYQRESLDNIRYTKGLVMEFMPFPDAGNIDPKHRPLIKPLVQEELRKARKLGFVPGEDAACDVNVLFSAEQEKIWFVDLYDWGRI